MISVRPVELKDVDAAVELVRVTLAEFGIVFGQGADIDTQRRATRCSRGYRLDL